MASRIFFNTAEQMDQAISGAWLNIMIRGSGFVRDTGVQNVSGQKFFFDTITFYSGLNVSGDFVPSGDVAGNLIPKIDNLYDLGSVSKEWRNLFIDGTGRIDSLHVDENASVTGDLFVNGNVTGSGNAYFAGTATVVGASQLGNLTTTGDFSPNNISSSLLPKTDNLYDLGSSDSEFRHLFIDGTGRIDSLVVDENATIASGLSVGGSISATGGVSGSNFTTSGSAVVGTLFITGTGIPASTGSAGTIGQIVVGSGYIYACTGTNMWARTHLTGWI